MANTPQKPTRKTPTGPANPADRIGQAALTGKQRVVARVILGGSALLVVGGMAAFYMATRFAHREHAHDAAQSDVITVNVGAEACTPNELTVTAGQRTFRIVNQSKRAVEWEILQGVMVIEERENIAPGFAQTLTAQLQPGEYEITCGLLSNPRGKLHVSAAPGTGDAPKAAPSMMDYIGPLSEYRVYLITQIDAMTQDLHDLQVRTQQAGADRQQLEAAFLRAHADYSRVAPVADAFGDLDKRLDARADQFEKRELDPGFTGFHRVAYLLSATPASGTHAALRSAVDQLVADTKTLSTRLDDLTIDPQLLAPLAARRLETVAGNLSQPGTAGNADAPLARADVQASVTAVLDGTDEIISLLRPMLNTASPALLKSIDADAHAARQLLPALPGNVDATAASSATLDGTALATHLMALAKDLRQINATLGMN